MLKPAQLYDKALDHYLINRWYDPEYIWYSGGPGHRSFDLADGNDYAHDFVSVSDNCDVLGYIGYSIDWTSKSAYNFGAMSFDIGNITFAKDIYQAIEDIFLKYHLNRMAWHCYADSPHIRGYRNFIKRCGGRECGYYRQATMLLDGKLHDNVMFECLSSEFKPLKKRGEKVG